MLDRKNSLPGGLIPPPFKSAPFLIEVQPLLARGLRVESELYSGELEPAQGT